MENAAGVSLGELIDFCARCVALGIPEQTKLRATITDRAALVALFAETQMATPLAVVDDGIVIEGGVIIEIPDEE